MKQLYAPLAVWMTNHKTGHSLNFKEATFERVIIGNITKYERDLVIPSKYMKTPSFLRHGLRWWTMTAGNTFFLRSGFPFFTVAVALSCSTAMSWEGSSPSSQGHQSKIQATTFLQHKVSAPLPLGSQCLHSTNQGDTDQKEEKKKKRRVKNPSRNEEEIEREREEWDSVCVRESESKRVLGMRVSKKRAVSSGTGFKFQKITF